MNQPELEALIQQARAGDPQAQEALVRDIQDRVYYHCKKMMKHESDAQDAAQDVLIAVLTGLDKLKEPAAFYGWVNGITANRCKHLLTRGNREWQIPEDEDGGSMLDELEDLDQRAVPEAVLENKETRRLMLELIDALPPDQRMCVLFYYYDEMSVKDIAQAMETSEGTVKSRLNYARKSIKAGVEDLEKRGTKLYGIAPLPLLLLFLRMEAAQSGMSAAQSAGLTASVLSAVQPAAGAAAGTGAAATGAAGGAAAKTGMALGTKIIAGILAIAVAAGAVAAAAQLLNKDEPEEDPPPVQAAEQLPEEPEPSEEPPAEGPQVPEEPDEPEGPSPELLALLQNITYYGDPAACRLTPEQAGAYAEVIREEMLEILYQTRLSGQYNSSVIRSCAALFDVGDGTPALFFGGGATYDWVPLEDGEVLWSSAGIHGIWQYQDGQAVPYAPEGQEHNGYWGRLLVLRDGSLFIGGDHGSDGSNYDGGVYPLTGPVIPTVPETSAGFEPIDLDDPYVSRYQIDGAEVTQEEFEAWQNQWEDQPVLCGHYWDGGAGGSFTGMGDPEAAADALEQYAAGLMLGVPGFDGPSDEFPDYAPAYARTVREMMTSGPDGCQFDLIRIDGDEVPELLVSYPDPGGFLRVNLYTAEGPELRVLYEDLVAGLRGSGMYYYPGQNVVRVDTSLPENFVWTDTVLYYQIGGGRTLELTDAIPETSGDPLPLEGTMTGEEMLSVLEP